LNEKQLERIRKILSENDLPTENPMLRLDVATQTIGSTETGQSKRMFTLCREDIISVFSAFGELTSVEIERNNSSDSLNKSES